jgi:hypothetical protein
MTFISRHNDNIYIKINLTAIKDLLTIYLKLILFCLVIYYIPMKIIAVCAYIYYTKYYSPNHERLEDTEAARLLKKYSSHS